MGKKKDDLFARKKIKTFFRDLGTGTGLVLGVLLLGRLLFYNVFAVLTYLGWFIGISVGSIVVVTILTLIGKLFWYCVDNTGEED